MNKNIPKLRFNEFNDEWQTKKLGEVVFKVEKRNKSKIKYPIYSINNVKGFIPQSEQFDGLDSNERNYDISLYKIIDNNTFAYNPARINVGSIGLNQNYGTVIISSLYVCFKTTILINDLFLNIIVKSDIFTNYVNQFGEGGDRIYLFYDNFSKIPISFPTLPEQEKIADFLMVVDAKLEKMKEKKQYWEQYKKGIMQKIFSQEIRFKDNNGNNYPDWQEKRLGEVFYSEKGKGISKDKLSIYGKNKCILYGELYTKYKEVIYDVISSTDYNEGVLSKKGDLLIPSSTTTSSVDLANVTALNYDGVLLGGDITILRSANLINNIFYAYYLTNFKKEEISNVAQGITIIHLYFSHLKDINIHLPSYEEQTKIADFLSSIDDKIEQINSEILEISNWKKGLLQQMFV